MASQCRQRRKSPADADQVPRSWQPGRRSGSLRIRRDPEDDRARNRQQEDVLEDAVQHAREPVALVHPDLVRHLQAVVRQRPGVVLPGQHAQLGGDHDAAGHDADHRDEPDVQLRLLGGLCVSARQSRETAADDLEYGAHVARFLDHHRYDGHLCRDQEPVGLVCHCGFYLPV